VKRNRHLGQALARVGFTLAYVGTVLPFTAAFFREVVPPPKGNILDLVSLADVYSLALPCFLGALEAISVGLACMFWKERKAEVLALFFLCQGLTVFSTFFDVRTVEWNRMVQVRSSAVQELREARAARAEAEAEKRRVLSRQLATLQVDARQLHAQLQRVTVGQEGPRIRVSRRTAEALASGQSDRQDRALLAIELGLRESSRRVAAVQEKLDKLDVSQREVNPATLPGTSAPTSLDYIGATLFTSSSLAAFLVAMLFPVTVLGVGRVLTAGESAERSRSTIDLSAELAEGASLPQNQHASYASLLEPALLAHVAAVRAARISAAETANLHLRLNAELDLVEACADFRSQILESDLEARAKQQLVDRIEGALAEAAA